MNCGRVVISCFLFTKLEAVHESLDPHLFNQESNLTHIYNILDFDHEW